MLDFNLRTMESRTWRANQQDGLFDLFFAVLFLGIALAQMADGWWDNEFATLGLLVGIQSGGAAGLWWARRRITQPRIGVVRFTSARKRRVRTTTVLLALCVAATASLVVLTALSGRGVPPFSHPVSRTTVSAIVAALVLTPLAAMAYFLEFPRILVHAGLFLAAEFGGTWLEHEAALPAPHAVTFGAAAIASGVIGAMLLLRFLRMRPENPSVPDPKGIDHA